ncbi:MAG: recombinase family protein [Candidatus Yonathbacteria bacterium]|nr:recombinase family protein [Candidatus Yonathbacteria bacterium]
MQINNQQLKYFIYCRKSTEDEDRQILSLDSQKKELEELAAHLDLRVIKIFKESKSAKEPDKRPVFAEITARIKCGEAQGVLCWKLDRLARNPDEAGKIIGMLQREEIKHIRTHEKDYRPEDNSLLSYVEFGIANQYIRDLSKNVKRGLKAKLEMGWYPSRAPLGYLNTERSEDKGRNWILKDPERFDMVKQMWQMMLTGNYTVMQILNTANKEWKLKTRPTKRHVGLKPLSRSNIYNIFTSPFYYGWFEYGKGADKQLYKGKHEPMITEEEFDRVQKILGRQGKPRPKQHRFAFTGLMVCSNCGAMITAEEKIKRQKNGNVHTYIYYHCTKRKDANCPERMIELSKLNAQIDEAIGQFTISDRFHKWAIEYLHELRKNEAQSQHAVFDNKQKILSDTTKRLTVLLDKYTSLENTGGQLISDFEYQTLKTRLLKEKADIESDLKTQGKALEDWLEMSERTFNFARYARIWFKQGDRDIKRAVFACLGSHFYLGGQNVSIEWRKSFSLIFEKLPQAEKELTAVRTSKNADNKRQIAVIAATCPTLRRR